MGESVCLTYIGIEERKEKKRKRKRLTICTRWPDMVIQHNIVWSTPEQLFVGQSNVYCNTECNNWLHLLDEKHQHKDNI